MKIVSNDTSVYSLGEASFLFEMVGNDECSCHSNRFDRTDNEGDVTMKYQEDLEKVSKIVCSCRNAEQLTVAKRVVHQFQLKYKEISPTLNVAIVKTNHRIMKSFIE